LNSNPYLPPQSNLEPVADAPAASPPLWNPDAAASWSLLLTPVFGALLHRKNWIALGEPDKAASAWRWALVSIAFYVLSIFASFLVSPEQAVAFGGGIRFGAFGLLLTWYFVSAKPQARFIKERFGKDYPRRGWGKPFLYALLAFVAVMLVAFLGGIIFAIVAGVLNGRVA
jgi:hypothetical protein